MQSWSQNYSPTGPWWVSALLAAAPLVLLLTLLLVARLKAHRAAFITLAFALVIAIGFFHMPISLALLSTTYGIAYGLFPVFWIVFPVIFLYELTVHTGRFALLQQCLAGVTQDSRLQLLLIAFAFGAFFEGAAGFGTPVAVCGALLLGLGFRPIQAAGLTLLANTAPVAFGALGTPVIALHGVTGIDTLVLSRLISILLTPFCVIVPFWLITVFSGVSGVVDVWPAILVSGVLFGATQLLVASFHGPWLVNITASLVTIAALMVLFRFWTPRRVLGPNLEVFDPSTVARCKPARQEVVRAVLPWAVLTLFVALWGTPLFVHALDSISAVSIHVPGLDQVVRRMPPIVPVSRAEPAVFAFNWLSATGTGIFIAALVAAFLMRIPPREIVRVFGQSLYRTRFTMFTISALMGFGFLTRFCGQDAVLGLAFARTGALYPFFGTLIGWLGTASTGSDTSSNVLFGSLQKLTAQQLGIAPALMAAANSGGGVMGKMIAPQSVVVASTATGIYGREGAILKSVILHSTALACLMGLIVLAAIHIPLLLHFLVK